MKNSLLPLWSPTEEFKKGSNLWNYMQWMKEKHELEFSSYESLWEWSVNNITDFWESLWHYFDIVHSGEYKKVIDREEMPFNKWFEGTSLSYSEHIFRIANSIQPAIIFKSETSDIKEISWNEVSEQVSSLQQYLQEAGITKGNGIAAYIPCVPEATVAFLAVNSLGAIWTSCSPDFGASSVIERFIQLEPKVLIVTDGYHYNGKFFDKKDVIEELEKSLPSVEHIIVIPTSQQPYQSSKTKLWKEVLAQYKPKTLHFERVPFNFPIWALYSSGTTGIPKAIVHSTGGILLEELKYGTFHNDFRPGDRCFWYTTTGWMMWNYIHGSLLAGGVMILYDGSPAYPDLNVLWQYIQDAGINHFGTSAGFILANMKASIQPNQFNLSSLRSIGSTGSTLPPEGFDWVYKNIKEDLWLTSMSGGTDVCSAFVGGNPLLPVYSGEIQCRALGCKLEVFDEEGHTIENEEGEMVITKPMPTMPIYFLGDPDNVRYHESYFEMYPGIWRHGDWIKLTERKGIIIYGRSDATLNRGGVRIGTSEIYRSVDSIKEIKDSLVVCIERSGGEFWMPLFVTMQEGFTLTGEVKSKINKTIRQDYSPRHVPDEIIEVPDIPYTISGKKTETPVKKILMGKSPEKVIKREALRNPNSLDFFIRLAK